ncbi:MAG: serine hydrolase [marine benthic group bacterium]|nr:serine hydrolase [Gemmatimonadota bacterium]MCL7990803.1 serine hydrolase [Gemmatimonadota bacterium]
MTQFFVPRVRALARSALLLAAGALSWSAPPASAQQVDWNRIDSTIETMLGEWTTPGVAVAVVKDDSVVFANGYGVRRLGEPDPVGPETRFAVASNTKAFTAALLAQQHAEEALAIDDRVKKHLPDFRMSDPWISDEIRINDLLTHRSGLPTFGGDHLWIGQDLARETVVQRVRWLEPTGPFRASFQYQNLMYLVAGQVAAAVAGMDWDRLVTERILDPLGMTSTTTTLASLEGLDDVAAAHEHVGGELRVVEYDDVSGVAPAAALNSTALDMARWMRANLNGGELDGTRILSERAVREMQSIHYPLGVSPWAEANLGQRFSGYGYGWFISEYKGRKVVSHSGGLTGMISLQTLLPEEGIGVVVLTNYAPDAPTRAITYTILDALLGEPTRDWNSVYRGFVEAGKERSERAEAELETSRSRDLPPTVPLESFVGTYANQLSGSAEVRMENDRLVFDYNPRHLGDLEHWEGNRFRVHWRHPIFDMAPRTFLDFETSEAGTVEALTVTFYHPNRFMKSE